MIKTTIIKKLSIFIVVLLFISCSKDNQIENKEILVNDHFVGLADIEAIAGGMEFPDGIGSNRKILLVSIISSFLTKNSGFMVGSL